MKNYERLVSLVVFGVIFLPLVFAVESSTNKAACYSHVQGAPVSCTGGTITQDTTSGACRTVVCTQGNASMKVLACNKPDTGSPQHFEMYKQSQSGSAVSQICLGDTCISSSGYAKSESYPICDDEPVCTPSSEVCDQKDNDCDGQVDEGNVCANTCAEHVEELPVTCQGGSIISDDHGSICRTVVCTQNANRIQAKACEKGSSFEVYRESYAGTPPKVCFGTTCVQENGYAPGTFPVCEEGNKPDIVASMLMHPQQANQEQTITVSLQTLNQGAGTLSGSYVNRFYLSVDSRITPDDILLGSDSETETILPGEYDSDTITLTLPRKYAGTYYFGVIVDATNAVSESDDTNNARYANHIVIRNPNTTDLGANSQMFLSEAWINGKILNSTNRTLTVRPGERIEGTIFYNYFNDWYGEATVYVGATATWSDHVRMLQSGEQILTEYGVRGIIVNYTAPTTPGTYYIITAFRAETSAPHVFSMTNWAYGAPVWYDGNDVAGWGPWRPEEAMRYGRVLGSVRYPDGYKPVYVPATAIRVVVR